MEHRIEDLRGNMCHCRSCGEYFNSTGAFDKHRVGTYQPRARRCLDVDEMIGAGMSLNSRGLWITSEMPILARWEGQKTADL